MKTTQKSKAVLGPNFANVNYCLKTGFNIKTFKKFKLKKKTKVKQGQSWMYKLERMRRVCFQNVYGGCKDMGGVKISMVKKLT